MSHGMFCLLTHHDSKLCCCFQHCCTLYIIVFMSVMFRQFKQCHSNLASMHTCRPSSQGFCRSMDPLHQILRLPLEVLDISCTHICMRSRMSLDYAISTYLPHWLPRCTLYHWKCQALSAGASSWWRGGVITWRWGVKCSVDGRKVERLGRNVDLEVWKVQGDMSATRTSRSLVLASSLRRASAA